MDINTSEIYLSKKGMNDIKHQIKRLERSLSAAQSNLRDVSKAEDRESRLERAEALAYIETLEAELADKYYTLENAKQLPRRRDSVKVALGSVVELIDNTGKRIQYRLVDSIEADPSKGRISIKSPLGKNLVGRRIRDIVVWTAGLKTNQLQLVNIA